MIKLLILLLCINIFFILIKTNKNDNEINENVGESIFKNKWKYMELEIEINELNEGKLLYEIRKDISEKAYKVLNGLCQNNEKGFKNSVFTQVMSGVISKGGNFETGKISTFENEGEKGHQSKYGTLSMANIYKSETNSEFHITLSEALWLESDYVVLGELIEGKEVLDKINDHGSDTGEIKDTIKIINCDTTLY